MKLELPPISSASITIAASATAVVLLSAVVRGQDPAWNLLAPAQSPPARAQHAMTYDSTRERVVLFGGRTASGNLGDTWEWDGENWIERFPAHSPTDRRWQGMAYDTVRQRVVLFAGSVDPAEVSNDLWEWDGNDWQQRFSSNLPPRRRHPGLVYDAARGKVFLFGGRGSGPWYDDSWEWDGSQWRQLFPAVRPSAREGHYMAYDPFRERVVLFGGGTTVLRNDTWEWDGVQWTQLFPAHAPSPRRLSGFAYDTELRGIVLFGGGGSDGRSSDTWLWDGDDWTEVTPANGPSDRFAPAMAYDAARRRTILFGGEVATPLADTWEFRSGPPDSGSFDRYGVGCAGAQGIPRLTADPVAVAVPGRDFTVRFENLHPSRLCVPFGILGDSRSSTGSWPLPVPLDTWGMTGCWLHVNNLDSRMLANGFGSATWVLPIPADPLLAGATFYVQGAVVEPGANPLGVITTNGGAIEIRDR